MCVYYGVPPLAARSQPYWLFFKEPRLWLWEDRKCERAILTVSENCIARQSVGGLQSPKPCALKCRFYGETAMGHSTRLGFY